MATSGTTTFNLDIGDILDEAYDLCGMEMRTGYDFKSDKRTLNLVFLECQNKGLNLWAVEQNTQTLTAGTSSYALPSSALDVVDAFIRTDAGNVDKQFDQRLNRISRTQYNHQATKLNKSKPTQFFVDKNVGTSNIVLWSTPDSAQTYTLVYDYIARVEDAGNPSSNNADVPTRYLPCLTYALAYNIATKHDEALQRVPSLKQRYDELWAEVSEADREKATVRFVPDLVQGRY